MIAKHVEDFDKKIKYLQILGGLAFILPFFKVGWAIRYVFLSEKLFSGFNTEDRISAYLVLALALIGAVSVLYSCYLNSVKYNMIANEIEKILKELVSDENERNIILTKILNDGRYKLFGKTLREAPRFRVTALMLWYEESVKAGKIKPVY